MMRFGRVNQRPSRHSIVAKNGTFGLAHRVVWIDVKQTTATQAVIRQPVRVRADQSHGMRIHIIPLGTLGIPGKEPWLTTDG